MTDMHGQADQPTGMYDDIVADLQRMRLEAGDVSYSAIAQGVTARRQADGLNPAAARVARSTVFDVFRVGRRRINADLVRDVVLALGADEQAADHWRQRCVDARVAAIVVPQPAAGVGSGDASRALDAATDGPSLDAMRAALVVTIVVACIGLNLFGGAVVTRLQLPLYLDMAGTATAAFALGPWVGAIVGVVTNLFGIILTGPETAVFALVNVAGALVWGYGIRRFASSLPRFLVLTVVVAGVCSAIGAPLNVLMYGGVMDHVSDVYVIAARMVDGLWATVFTVNFVVSLADKIIASFVALALARLITPLRLSGRPVPPLLVRRGRRTAD